MTLTAAVISLRSKSSKWTVKAMQNYFRTVDDIDARDIEVTLSPKKTQVLHKGKPLDKYDCILVKGSFRYAQILRAVTTIASENSYMPIQPSAFTIAHDKLLTHLKLQQKGIPAPTTYLTSTPEAAKKILETVNYPIIMKFPQGTQGKGVMFADSFASANSMLDALIALKQPFLIQEYVETGGADIRAIVVGDKVVAAMQRKAEMGEKRANIHAGGSGEAVELDPKTKKIAIDAAKALGADICAIDILESIKGPVVLEINISPGLQGITKATGIDVASKIAKFLRKKAEEYSTGKGKEASKEIMKELTPKGPGKEIITGLDFRGERILLPGYVTKETGFKEDDELVIRVNKGKLILEPFDIGKEKE
ncbi:RimK family alpha-L-glutamate ligase [Candidatus Woesearchaeota archaeon]|nr:RimK family alpha-L-glutamate ligase [Candidatus Woesearchaeota archaeon]